MTQAETDIRAAEADRAIAERRRLVVVAAGHEMSVRPIIDALEVLTVEEACKLACPPPRWPETDFESGAMCRHRPQG